MKQMVFFSYGSVKKRIVAIDKVSEETVKSVCKNCIVHPLCSVGCNNYFKTWSKKWDREVKEYYKNLDRRRR